MVIYRKIIAMVVLLALPLLFQNCDELASNQDAPIPSDTPSSTPENIVIDYSPPSRKNLTLSNSSHIAFPLVHLDNQNYIHVYYTDGSEHYGVSNDKQIKKITSLDTQGWNFSAPQLTLQENGWNIATGGLGIINNQVVMSVVRTQYSLIGQPHNANGQSRTTSNRVSYANISNVDNFTLGSSYLNGFPYGSIFELGSDTFLSAYNGSLLNVSNGNGQYDTGAGGLLSSDDITWGSASRSFLKNGDLSPTETDTLNLGDGELLSVTRMRVDNNLNGSFSDADEDYYLYSSKSYDGGLTWSAPDYLIRGGPANLLKLKSGSIVMCYTHRASAISNSTSGGIYCTLSKDNGASWSDPKQIYTNNVYWDFGYVQSIQLESGKIFSVYYANNGAGNFMIQRALWGEGWLEEAN